ncbi:hypothetical protein LCGC14_2883100, partial [marine sediment metagenome]
MAVIDLRGERGSNIALIGKSIGKVIRSIKGPDAADRRAFLGRVLGDPEKLEDFGRIARDSPQALPEFLKDEDIEMLRSTLPTLEELETGIRRPGLTPEPKGGDLTPEAAEFLGRAGAAGQFGLTAEGVELGPKRVAAARGISQEDVTTGLQAEVTGIPALTPGQEAAEDFNVAVFNSALEGFSELEPDPQKQAALRDKLPAAFHSEDFQANVKLRKELLQMQIDAQTIERSNERIEAAEISNANRWVLKTSRGTPEMWARFLYNKEDNQRALALARGEATPETQSDIDLLEVGQAFDRTDQVDRSLEIAAIQT